MSLITTSIIGSAIIEGAEAKSYLSSLKSAALMPTLSLDDGTSDIIIKDVNASVSPAFNDEIGSERCVGIKKRSFQRSLRLSQTFITSENINLDSTFTDSSPDLGSMRVNDFVRSLPVLDVFFNGSILAGAWIPNAHVPGNDPRKEALMGDTLGAQYASVKGTNSISEVISLTAPPFAAFLDGDTLSLMNFTDGAVQTIDTAIAPYDDKTNSEVVFIDKLFTLINASLIGVMMSDDVLSGEKLSSTGFTFENATFGYGNSGTDSIAFGGWMR